jgi:hypothetical protein
MREGIISIRWLKTDQEAVGRKIGVSFGRTIHCPVTAVNAWLAAAQIKDGLSSIRSIAMAESRLVGSPGRLSP